uniref:BRCT domain-containing protein n=1 Tax=Strongyloides stercoralis TaxID=6248 RepID=A0A0K0EA19_STRER
MKDSTAEFITFSELCQLLNDIFMTNDRMIKEKLFKDFVDKWFYKKREIFTIYPVLRLIVQSDKIGDRLIFEFNHLKKFIVNDLNIEDINTTNINELSIIEKVDILINMYPKKFEASNISIASLNKYIDQFLQCRNVEKSITELLRNMNDLERKWFLLILLIEVENVTKMDLYDLIWCINPALEQLLIDDYQIEDIFSKYYPNCCFQKDIIEKLTSISIGKPFIPMKLKKVGCEECDFLKIKEICKGKLLAEKFYNAERVMIHRYNNGKNYKFFSENNDDFTMFYTSPEFDLSKKIETCFKNDVKNVILEGQMLVKCCNSGNIIEKFDMSSEGTFYDSRFINRNDQSIKICFLISDILYFNTKSLINCSLEERLKILNEDVFNEINNETIMISKQKEISTYENFFECLENAIIEMQKGFILKDSASYYVSGTVQDNHCLFHIIPNYFKFVTLYLTVVGVEYCETKPSVIKNFLLAAKDSNNIFIICLKVPATRKLKLFNDIINSIDIKNNYHFKLPSYLRDNLQCNSSCRYVFEDNTTIVEVKWININCKFKKLLYIFTIRNDLSKEHVNLHSDVEYFEEKLDKGINNVEVIPPVVNNLHRHESNTKKSLIEIDNLESWKIFEQLTICVLNCPKYFDIKKIQKFIYFLGASIVSHPTKDTCYIIASDPTNVKTAAALQMKNMPILDANWVIRCINEKRLHKIDLENDVLLLSGTNQFSLENLNYLIEKREISDDVLDSIFLHC